VTDTIEHEAAALLIELDCSPSPDLVSKIEQWKAQSARHRKTFDELQFVWDMTSVLNTKRVQH
jgi:ferric-dicitrate binding protein FerR (iron transport regulator)